MMDKQELEFLEMLNKLDKGTLKEVEKMLDDILILQQALKSKKDLN